MSSSTIINLLEVKFHLPINSNITFVSFLQVFANMHNSTFSSCTGTMKLYTEKATFTIT